jgi:tetratricopeptide (TPR) repeat protein
MSDDGIRLQNLRDFTVQICHVATDAIVGTGVVVSMDGKIVTCAHVIIAAGVNPRLGRRIPSAWGLVVESIFGRKSGPLAEGNGAEVGVYFPQVRGGEARRATVVGYFPQHEDDVVVLQLIGGPAPLGQEQIAKLGRAEPSEGNAFRSYGYTPIGDHPATRAGGTIMGTLERARVSHLQADLVQLSSRQIDKGMSGAAVLDEERNLIVGLIAERHYPDNTSIKDDVGYAVDAYVLTFDPLNLPVRDAPLPKGAAPQPKTDIAEARAAVAPNLEPSFNGASPPLDEWVGRAELLREIGADWADPAKRATGLIGFGGEGKSSLARRWLDDLLADTSLPRPDGVFWWGFYDKPGIDEFFEAALKYMGGGRIDPRALPSSNVRAQVIGAMLGAGRYLFVLDGLEVLQHQDGDQYGLLASADLREFLGYFAAPGGASFCLITSRIPLFDLQSYTTYTHRDVDRLSAADGRALLRRLGVKGGDAALDKVVSDWDGHALTLSLLAAYLTDRYGGDITHIHDIPAPTTDEPRYERVQRVLRRYDEHLSAAERAFLTLFSAFRTPVREDAFEPVFRAKTSAKAINAPIAALDDAAFAALLKRLVDYRILRRDRRAGYYTTHPLIRAHYFARLTADDRAEAQAAHEHIKDYYLAIAGDTPYNATLDDLAQLIEAVYHACRAGAHDEAYHILRESIYQQSRFVIIYQLGAWETTLALLLEFFPANDTSQEPQVSAPINKSLILNDVGLCLMSLGRLAEAAPFFERSNVIALSQGQNASPGYINLAGLHAYLGDLAASADAARQAVNLARHEHNKKSERQAMAHQAWVACLHGDLDIGSAIFEQAEALQREGDPNKYYLYSNRGIFHADHLRRLRAVAYARRVTEANLEICERNRWGYFVSGCHRVLGDLDADTAQHERARQHYEEALKIARSISHRPSLIEALLARGRWAARRGDVAAARADLDEALAYAVAGGYRRYEADIRVGLAWAHHAAGDAALARAEAERARQMSVEMGYHWGPVDADEVLAAIESPDDPRVQ